MVIVKSESTPQQYTPAKQSPCNGKIQGGSNRRAVSLGRAKATLVSHLPSFFMTDVRAYDLSNWNRSVEGEIHRLRLQVDLSWKKEARNLSWFGLQDGMSVLELGSGPGFFTEKLLSLVPNSSITAVEIDPTAIKYFQQYLQGITSDRLKMIEASIMDTNIPDNSFDFAIVRYVFWNIPDPIGAAKEVLRVLKPGGKCVITDYDNEFYSLVDPPVPKHQLGFEKFYQFATANGGNPKVGRYLWRILEETGFTKLNLEAVILHSDELGIEPLFKISFDDAFLVPVIQQGFLTENEWEEIRAEKKQFLSSPNALIMIEHLMICGEKPLAT